MKIRMLNNDCCAFKNGNYLSFSILRLNKWKENKEFPSCGKTPYFYSYLIIEYISISGPSLQLYPVC